MPGHGLPSGGVNAIGNSSDVRAIAFLDADLVTRRLPPGWHRRGRPGGNFECSLRGSNVPPCLSRLLELAARMGIEPIFQP